MSYPATDITNVCYRCNRRFPVFQGYCCFSCGDRPQPSAGSNLCTNYAEVCAEYYCGSCGWFLCEECFHAKDSETETDAV